VSKEKTKDYQRERRLDIEGGCLDLNSVSALRRETSTLKYITLKTFTF